MKNNTPNFASVVEGVLNRMSEKDEVLELQHKNLYDSVLSLTPVYLAQDDFAIVLLVDTMIGNTVAVGVSKRNPIDQKNLLRGRSLALSRAVRGFVKGISSRMWPVVDEVDASEPVSVHYNDPWQANRLSDASCKNPCEGSCKCFDDEQKPDNVDYNWIEEDFQNQQAFIKNKD
jgi:hypothetical protein